jgi:hypothetical protein
MDKITYKINPSFIFSRPSDDCVKVISIDQDDNNVYTIKGVSADVFTKLVNGEKLSEIKAFIQKLENSPSEDKIDIFLEQFIKDLHQLKFIQAR